MGKKNNRSCLICGRSYSYCPSCGADSSKPTWYFLFDCKNCLDIYDVCTEYRDNILNAKEAYEKVSKLDISKLENFNDVTKGQIKEIIELNQSVRKNSADKKLHLKTVKDAENDVLSEINKTNKASNLE